MALAAGFEFEPRAELTDQLVCNACKLFGLTEPTQAQDLEGCYNLNVKLECGPHLYVLRVYRPWVTKQRVELIQSARERLADSGIPTAPPVGLATTADLGLWGNRVVELERYIENDGSADSWDTHADAFRVLARLHRRLEEAFGPNPQPTAIVDNYATPQEMVARMEATIAALLVHRSDPEVRDATESLREAAEFVRSLIPESERVRPHLPGCTVHGDFNCATNVLLRQRQIAGVLDFDMMSRHERLFDLAYAAFFSAGCVGLPPDTWLRQPVEERPWNRVPELLEAYAREAAPPLTRMEVDSFAQEMARVQLFWLSTAGYEEDPVKSIHQECMALKNARWMIAHLNDSLVGLDSIILA